MKTLSLDSPPLHPFLHHIFELRPQLINHFLGFFVAFCCRFFCIVVCANNIFMCLIFLVLNRAKSCSLPGRDKLSTCSEYSSSEDTEAKIDIPPDFQPVAFTLQAGKPAVHACFILHSSLKKAPTPHCPF
jgi:hypothetical protein